MIIAFSPQYRDHRPVIHKAGDVLTINGEVFDLSVIGEGDELPEAAFVGTDLIRDSVTRHDGQLRITLRLPYQRLGKVETPPPLIDPPDGVLVLPNLNQEAVNAD